MATFAANFFDENRVLLAPMAGVSDPAFRTLCIELGADLAYTEMVSAKGLSYGNEKTGSLIALAEGESCIAVQLFGHEPATLAQQACKVVGELGDALAFIDINMGCPARKIVSKGDGSALMTDPARAKAIIRAVSDAVDVPVTVKFRRGFEMGDETCIAFAAMAEEAGAAAVAVHGRFSKQYYSGKADWRCIAQVKRAVSLPVIGNGDVFTGHDALALKQETACDAIMIGRGAQGNPWIFAEAQAALDMRPLPERPSYEERIAMAKRHAALLSEGDAGNLSRMRKHAMWYLSGMPYASAARREVCSCTTLDDFCAVFDQLLDAIEGQVRYA